MQPEVIRHFLERHEKHGGSERCVYFNREGTMKYKIALQKTEEGYSVSVPGLPGCWSQGATEDEAVANIREAIQEHIAVRDQMAGRDDRARGRSHHVAIAIETQTVTVVALDQRYSTSPSGRSLPESFSSSLMR